MSNPEHSPPYQRRLDRFAGNIFAGAAEVYLQHIRYIGREKIDQTDEILKSGSSVLLVSNHPNTLSTMWASNIETMLYNRRASGIILKYAFSPENKKNLIGDIVRLIVTHHHVEPLFVKTKKYFPDDEERRKYNEKAKNRGNEILSSPGGVLFLFAEGTRTEEKMGHAESGLTKYSALAGYVLPITIITDSEHPTVVIHPPIPGKAGVAWCEKEFGQEDGAKVFSSLIMIIIATAQPNLEKKGVYKETSQVMEDFIAGKLNFDDIPERHIKQVLSAFIAWKNNKFDI